MATGPCEDARRLWSLTAPLTSLVLLSQRSSERMSSIWVQGTQGWELLLPHGFEDEATLHDLISDAPQVLPLSGSPRLVVLGREVPLGPGLADIVAVETGGRPVVIEVKLARSPEARRAVIAQLLSYAASLYRSTPGAFAAAVARSITGAGHGTILEAVEAADQEESVDPTTFAESLRQSLESGDIRLVLVLDSAPPELQAVVGYLEAVAPNLTLDLVTVPAFRVGERAVVIPQRIEPARVPPRGPLEDRGRVPLPAPSAVHSDGSAEFEAGIEGSPPEQQPELRRLLAWAQDLEALGLARLRTGQGQQRWTLLPVVTGRDAGLVTVWNDRGTGASMALWRSTLTKWAPKSLTRMEALEPPITIGQGNTLRDPSDEILVLLRAAYEEAAEGHG
jgi:hypothetical protein